MARLFVDMDGTLCKFNQIDKIEELYEEGYFLNLEPNQNVVDAVKDLILQGNVDVYILSCCLEDSEYAFEEKNKWLDKYLPEIEKDKRIMVPYGTAKTEYIEGLSDTDYLLDDYTVNLIDWEPPGKGVKLVTDINDTHKTWTGQRVYADNEPGVIASEITNRIDNDNYYNPLRKSEKPDNMLESSIMMKYINSRRR